RQPLAFSRNPVKVFNFYRLRFSFEALQPLAFPPGESGNLIRGILGRLLRQVASPEEYRDLFEPGEMVGGGPSALKARPRPFVIRCAHLDGVAISPGNRFFLDLHLFELRRPVLPTLARAFENLHQPGPGRLSGRARLLNSEALDLEGKPSNVPL